MKRIATQQDQAQSFNQAAALGSKDVELLMTRLLTQITDQNLGRAIRSIKSSKISDALAKAVQAVEFLDKALQAEDYGVLHLASTQTAGFSAEESSAAADAAIDLISKGLRQLPSKNTLGNTQVFEWLSQPKADIGIRVLKGKPGNTKSGVFLMVRDADREWVPVPVMWSQRKEAQMPEAFIKGTIRNRGSFEWGVSKPIDLIAEVGAFTKEALSLLNKVK